MSTETDEKLDIDNLNISSDAESKLIVEKASNLVDELYNYRDKYYEGKEINDNTSHQKVIDVKEKLQQTLIALDEFQWTRNEKAYYNLFVGKALNVIAEYDSKCQESLSKSIKLNPKLSEAWYQLGECHWKNNDIDGAFNCFKSALEYQSDKHILRAMSMVLRQLPTSSLEERKMRFTESINKAKDALKLDINDGKSWAILGSAYLNSFLGNPFNPKSMSRALSAYQKAIKDPIANTDPDLHYNYGIALQYESDFHQCLNQWNFAARLDPTWRFPRESISKTVVFLDELTLLIQNRGKMKEKRFRQLIGMLNDKKTREKDLGPYNNEGTHLDLKMKFVQFSDLKEGLNSNCIVLAKVICGLVQGDQLAYSIIIADQNAQLMSVRIFNLGQGKGPVIGDSIAIPEPYVEKICVPSHVIEECNQELNKNKSIFKFDYSVSKNLLENGINQLVIRVSIPSVLVVNGRKVNNKWTALPVVQNLYFTENWLSSMN